MIPVPWVNHLAVGPGLPLSASGESAPRPGAPELHFVSHMNISDKKASLRAGFFWLFRVCGGRLAAKREAEGEPSQPQIMTAWEMHQPLLATALPGKSWHGPQAAAALPW